ncbi:hypothetical protein Dimus_037537, partial [Dionaea muscipula]
MKISVILFSVYRRRQRGDDDDHRCALSHAVAIAWEEERRLGVALSVPPSFLLHAHWKRGEAAALVLHLCHAFLLLTLRGWCRAALLGGETVPL